MHITPVRTARVNPHDDLFTIIDDALPVLQEGDVIVVTSKIISLCEGCIVAKDTIDKRTLIAQEADAVIANAGENKYNIYLTIKNKLLIPTAGIDESNAIGVYILYPKDIQKSATAIWHHLRTKHKISNLGVIVSDSHTTPLRYGVQGIGLGWCGFEPLYNYVGKPDCFGNPLRVTKAAVLDSLSVAAVFVMGEGDEVAALQIDLENDLYAPLLTSVTWNRKKI